MATDSVTVSPTFNGDSVSLTAGMIVRLKPGANNNVVRAQADSAPHVQGVNGVVVSGAAAPGGVVTVVCTGRETVQMESGLTPNVGDTVFVSPNAAGKGTNVLPGQPFPIGTIADITNYARLGTMEVDVNISAAGAAGAFPGYGTPATILGNLPTPGTSSLLLRADSIPGQNITEEGPLPVSNASPNSIWFALDGNNGNDINQGWSTVSMAVAGTVAVKTAARLNQILPIAGKGRNVVVAIAAATYAEWASFLSGRYGSNSFVCRGTVTDPTSGSVAFSDSVIDRIVAGGVTATGMNATGYNPTAGATTRSIPCQLNGGGAAAFPAEVPISYPGGCRLRFDANTTTAALRGVVTSIVKVSGGNTLEVVKLLPAAPATTDVFYIEMPGVVFQHIATTGACNDVGNTLYIVGLQTNGTISGGRGFYCGGNVQTAFCHHNGTGIFSFSKGNFGSANSVYLINGSTVDTGGMTRSVGSLNFAFYTTIGLPTGHGPYFSSSTAARLGDVEYPAGFVAVGGLTVELTGNGANNESDPDVIGTDILTEAGIRAARILGSNGSAGLSLGSSVVLGSIEFSGIGASPCIQFYGCGQTLFIIGPLANGTSGGNTDVGLDLTRANGSKIILNSVPTVTGTAGDVRLSDGTIISWTTAAAGTTDKNGNQIYAPGNAPIGSTIVSAATAVALGNVAPATVTSSTPTAWTPLVINGVKYLVPLWPST